MTKLHELYDQVGQSPWIDNLQRAALRSGALEAARNDGIRGVTSNPTIFQKSVTGGSHYDAQLAELLDGGHAPEEAYWELAITDVREALALFRPLYDRNGGDDGFVSIEVAPSLAHDTAGTVEAARWLHGRIDLPNLLVKIPATAEGVPAIRQMISEGRSVNITLIFSLARYGEVIDAYLEGLEAFGGDASRVHSVASFFVSRVDTEVDRRLEAIGSDEALGLRGQAAVAQAKLAYALFQERFSGGRWDALVEGRAATVQRPLWASTSTKNPAYPDLLYVESLEGPRTVNTMPEPTIKAFCEHGRVACTIDQGVKEARETLDRLRAVGVDMDDVAATLERGGRGQLPGVVRPAHGRHRREGQRPAARGRMTGADYDAATALLVVDVQNDFADPGGSLYVQGGEKVVEAVNAEVERAAAAGATVAYTQDWHPPDTPHFEKDGGIWPVHCVGETWGAALHPGLKVADVALFIPKGADGQDGYSAFSVRQPLTGESSETGLADLLRARGVERVVIAGLATDYCVKETALDAIRLGFATTVVGRAIAAVDLQPGDGERAIEEMQAAGAAVR